MLRVLAGVHEMSGRNRSIICSYKQKVACPVSAHGARTLRMVRAMAPVTGEDTELLLDGARYGDVEDVQSALEQRVSADATDDSGRTGEAVWSVTVQRLSASLGMSRLLPSRMFNLTAGFLPMQPFTWHQLMGTQAWYQP